MTHTFTSATSATIRSQAQRRRLRHRTWGRIHWPLAGATVALAAFGVVMVLSAGRGPGGDVSFGLRQLLFAGVGLLAMALVASRDYRDLYRINRPLLFASLVALALVLSPAGSEVRGTKGWFRVAGFSLQPSEFAKLTLILGLAVIFSKTATSSNHGFEQPGRLDRSRSAQSEARQFAVGIGLLGLLGFAVLAQGEAGTVLVYCAVALGMFSVAGVGARYLGLLVVTGVLVIGFALSSGLLAPYQVDRFEAFLDSDLDPQGIGYNQQQAVTAIGSGGLVGAGLFDGPQTQLGYLPDQHTDFIFAAVAEELGFVGAFILLSLEASILLFVFVIGRGSADRFGRLLCAGVFSLLAFQVFQNVGMNLRLMPITGISLPFVSYGGSSMVTAFIALGIVQSVAAHPSRNRPDEHRSGRNPAGRKPVAAWG